ncbi:MAG: helix-turn-helix domain-containing protein, partial [Ruminococcaceae bacterium]|nr:helix-turn-helix domain-containing protein [Oscillospiraceae bacterium]
ELMHIDTRAEWLNDPFAKEAIAAKEREAERKVRNFIERTEAALKGSHHVLSEERRWIIDMYRKGHSQKSIAAMLGRSKCTVSKIINEWRKEQWTTE